MTCRAWKVNVTSLIKIQQLHLRDGWWSFIFCACFVKFIVLQLRKCWLVKCAISTWWSPCVLQADGFVYLPQIVSDGFWRIWMLSLIVISVRRTWRSTQQTPRTMSQIVRVCIWKNVVCEIMKTLSIYTCSNVFIWGRPLMNVFLLFSLHCEFLPKANAARMENANEKSIKTYFWF